MSARLATAAALLLAFGGALALAAYGWSWGWQALLVAAAAAGAFEWARLLGLSRAWCAAYALPPLLALVLAVARWRLCPALECQDIEPDSVYGVAAPLLLLPLFVWVVWAVMLPFGFLLRAATARARAAARAVWGLGGLLLVPAAAVAAVMLVEPVRTDFPAPALFLLLVTAATDAAAFLAGRRFGRRLLAPRISPGKTWVGLGAGLAAAGAAGVGLFLLLSLFFLLSPALGIAHAPWGRIILDGLTAGLALGACVALGDLMVSALKRSAGVKDSGRLLPGHGGALDRIDGFLLAAPAFLLMLFTGWPVDFAGFLYPLQLLA